MPASSRRLAGRLLALLAVLALSVFIFAIRNQVEELAVYGYPGIFLLSILTSATVILPAPSLLIVFSMGGVFNPIGVGIAAGSGAALGELSGYLAGVSGRAVVENTYWYTRLHDWMKSHWNLSYYLILLLAFLPLPIFDLAGIAAGTLKMPVSRFLWWVWLGKLLKMLVVSYLGALSFGWLSRL